jgi:NDP-sugar pyrophosphorylase family protein
MKAMILAAGMGTRLHPLTNDRPKALVEVAGHTLLELTLSRLRSFGVRDVIVNVHHYADMIVEYLRARNDFGMHIEISREDALLDTGGGLKKAAHFFLDSNEPFYVHNVDVLSMIDLGRMAELHRQNGALATLAVKKRETSRYLLFDKDCLLCGRRTMRDGKTEWSRTATDVQELAFSGIHVISPRLFAKIEEDGAFSIITAYLRLASQGEKIAAFRADEYSWRDLGKPESVVEASKEMAAGQFSVC